MITLLHGDCREVLKTLATSSVQCCVTSPPYFGLRDYGVDRQIGLEATPEAFVAELVAVFREVRRVLRDDGTLWLNLGDSYGAVGGLRPKNLLGMPWRVAFALQQDGWYLRQDIIWAKPNPMPESVTDRCTKAHEYVFLMSKRARYFYDAEAIHEKVSETSHGNTATFRDNGAYTGGRTFNNGAVIERGSNGRVPNETGTRNKRSVWTIATAPFGEAHFATFPPELAETCIKAGCPPRVCSQCGKPWQRSVEVESRANAPSLQGKYNGVGVHRTISGGVGNDARTRIDYGFTAACSCAAAWVPGTVLDPFAGAGTTGLVADRLQRDCVLIELSTAYAEMGEARLRADAGLFSEIFRDSTKMPLKPRETGAESE